MDKYEPNSIEQEDGGLWGSGFYETGHTTPPKDYSGVAAVLLVTAIVAVSLLSAMGLLRLSFLANQAATDPEEMIVFSTAPTAFENFSLDKREDVQSTAETGVSTERSEAISLGLQGYRVPEMYRYVYRMPDGLYLTDVDACSDAARQGLQPGDVLLSVNGQTVTDQASLETILLQCQPGQSITAQIYRGGSMASFELTIDTEE